MRTSSAQEGIGGSNRSCSLTAPSVNGAQHPMALGTAADVHGACRAGRRPAALPLEPHTQLAPCPLLLGVADTPGDGGMRGPAHTGQPEHTAGDCVPVQGDNGLPLRCLQPVSR
jgi:hypothetical protein